MKKPSKDSTMPMVLARVTLCTLEAASVNFSDNEHAKSRKNLQRSTGCDSKEITLVVEAPSIPDLTKLSQWSHKTCASLRARARANGVCLLFVGSARSRSADVLRPPTQCRTSGALVKLVAGIAASMVAKASAKTSEASSPWVATGTCLLVCLYLCLSLIVCLVRGSKGCHAHAVGVLCESVPHFTPTC